MWNVFKPVVMHRIPRFAQLLAALEVSFLHHIFINL